MKTTLALALTAGILAWAAPASAESDPDRFPAYNPPAAAAPAKAKQRLPRNARCEALMANARMDGRILTQPRFGGSIGVGLTGGSLGIVPALGMIFTPTNDAVAVAISNRAAALCQAETSRDQVSRWVAHANAAARARSEAARIASLEASEKEIAATRERFKRALEANELTLSDFLEVDKAAGELRTAVATSKIEIARHRATMAIAGRVGPNPSVGSYLAAATAGQAAENELRRAGAKSLSITIGLGISVAGHYATGDGQNREDEAKAEAAAHRAALSQWSDIPNSVRLLRTQAAREASALWAASAMLDAQKGEVQSLMGPLEQLDGIRAEAARTSIRARLAIIDAERARMESLAAGLSRIAGGLGGGSAGKGKRAKRARRA